MNENQIPEESTGLSTLYVVESDFNLHEDYARVAERLSLRLKLLSSVRSFLELDDYARPCCLIFELSVDNESGEDLQMELVKRRVTFPIIVNTDHVDVESAVRVMERGAFTVLRKPTPTKRLQQYVKAAIELDKNQLEFDLMHRKMESILETLTARQRRILDYVVGGLPTKAIARKLGVSDRLVENERSEILRKFDVPSTPDVTFRMGQFRILEAIRLRFDPEHKGPLRPTARKGMPAEGTK